MAFYSTNAHLVSVPTQAAAVEGVAAMARLVSVSGKLPSPLEGSNPDPFSDITDIRAQHCTPTASLRWTWAPVVSAPKSISAAKLIIHLEMKSEFCAYQLMLGIGVGIYRVVQVAGHKSE